MNDTTHSYYDEVSPNYREPHTQFGFEMAKREDKDVYTEKNMWGVVDHATSKGVRVEIDMEHSGTHGFTVGAFKRFSQRLKESHRGGMLGLALQANYESTPGMLRELLALNGRQYGQLRFRLVKGVYKPPGDGRAIGDDREAMERYEALLFQARKARSPHRVVLGTHREDMVLLQREVERRGGLPAELEIQVLKGIRPLFTRGLARQGMEVWEYVPIGSREVAGAYAARRLGRAAGLVLKTASDAVLHRRSLATGGWIAKVERKRARFMERAGRKRRKGS